MNQFNWPLQNQRDVILVLFWVQLSYSKRQKRVTSKHLFFGIFWENQSNKTPQINQIFYSWSSEAFKTRNWQQKPYFYQRKIRKRELVSINYREWKDEYFHILLVMINLIKLNFNFKLYFFLQNFAFLDNNLDYVIFLRSRTLKSGHKNLTITIAFSYCTSVFN